MQDDTHTGNGNTNGDTPVSDPTPDQPDFDLRDDADQPSDDPLNRDDDGSLIDPPVIASYERAAADAAARGDVDDLAEIQREYDQAREERARALHDRAMQEAAR